MLADLESAKTRIAQALAMKENVDAVERGKQLVDEGKFLDAIEASEQSLNICEQYDLADGSRYALEQIKLARTKFDQAIARGDLKVPGSGTGPGPDSTSDGTDGGPAGGNGEASAEETLTEAILGIYEESEVVNGGILEVERLQEFLAEKGHPASPVVLQNTLEMLAQVGMVHRVIEWSDTKLVCFREIDFSEEELELLEALHDRPIMTPAEIAKKVKKDEEVVLELIKGLQEKQVLRLRGDKVEVPGLRQETA